MKKEWTGNPSAREENVEIELSAEELRRLSQPRVPPRPPTAARRFGTSPALIAAAASVAVVAACAGVWALNADTPEGVAPPPVLAAVEEPAAPPPPLPEGAPVRVQNPFDKDEVFEFPPGTSEEDAHAKVADALMRRAMERQALLNAKPAKRRRAG